MRSHVSAPAPRFLLRALVIESLVQRRLLAEKPFSSVCEIGAGLGDLASYLNETLRPDRFDLHEASEEARRILENRFADSGNLHVLDAFEGGGRSHDLLFCCEVLEHVEDDEGFLLALRDAIRPGGTFVGSVPAYGAKWQSGDALVGHFRRYEPEELEQKLRRAGFRDIELMTYGFPLLNILQPARELYYRRELQHHHGREMEEATRHSGIARRFVRAFNVPLVYRTARLFDLFRHLPGKSALDDGLVFIGRRGP